jgi:hypothetical protein
MDMRPTMANTDPIQHAEKLGAESISWFTDQSESLDRRVVFRLASPFCYTWSGVACIKPMGAFLNTILWGCVQYPKLSMLSV